MSNNKPISIAIVGRPNVGKSTLFNRIIKERRAIETPEAGTTRDRLYGDFIWRGVNYQLIDTAGMLFGKLGELESAAQESTQIATEEADIIIFVVDFKEGITNIDLEIAKTLRKHPKTILAVNKSDNRFDAEAASPFRRLGIRNIVLVSAISGKNSGDLLDKLHEISRDLIQTPRKSDSSLKEFNLSIIGRPNAGKSTLLNTITGEKKMIVSSVAGTTRDSQEISFDQGGYRINLVDTAGIKRKSKVKLGSPEGYALLRSYKAIRDCDILVYLIDVTEGLVSIDQTILGEAKKRGKSAVLAINKIDEWQDSREKKMAEFISLLQSGLNFMPWVPVVFISAKDNINIGNLLNQCIKAIEQRQAEIGQEECDTILAQAKARNSQINYIKSLHFERPNPIVFKIRTNKNKKPHFSHLRYLENQIRDVYPLPGNPIYIDWLR